MNKLHAFAAEVEHLINRLALESYFGDRPDFELAHAALRYLQGKSPEHAEIARLRANALPTYEEAVGHCDMRALRTNAGTFWVDSADDPDAMVCVDGATPDDLIAIAVVMRGENNDE